MLYGKQYCITLFKQSPGKRGSRIISTLFSRIDTGYLWRALIVLTRNIFNEPNLREKSMSTLINKAVYGCWRKKNSFKVNSQALSDS